MDFNPKIMLPVLLAVLFFTSITSPVTAANRNIFGLHLTQTSDIHQAAGIINSSGGKWGWVTIVIRQDQLNRSTWQQFFDDCRRYHLQPIIRLSTLMKSDYWQRPTTGDVDQLAGFLNTLNWPTKTQHIIVYNEPNHANEWGGGVDAKGYADISTYVYDKFKSLNPNFFILGPALDQATPDNLPKYQSAPEFIREIFLYRPEYFQKLDGLASHSYPNHGFVGSPADTGIHSIRGYEWELDYLRRLGLNHTYPVFITETGWPHREGQIKNNLYFTAATTAKHLSTALDLWQQDDRVQAVTPFIFNYPNPPFDHFSWLDSNQKLYPEYQLLTDRPKTANSPPQTTSHRLIRTNLPFLIFSDREYAGSVILQNNGQSIWGETQFCLSPQSTANVILDAICTGSQHTPPGHQQSFTFKFKIDSSVNFTSKTFISWEGLPPLEITPFSGTDKIYHPNSNIFDSLNRFLKRLFY